MWNKQRYCGQLQNHVRIANFSGESRNTSIPSKSSYFFMVLWSGRSCKEMCGAILWVSQLDDSTTLPSIYSMHRWPPLQRRRNEIFWRIVISMLQNCSTMFIYLARIGRLDILWSVSELARSITKWTKACDKRLNRLISYIHHTCEYRQYCHVGNIAKQCRLGLFQDSDFAGRSWGLKNLHQVGTLCIFGSRTLVPISWMCKKQTSVSHNSTESEIIFLGAGLRLNGKPALDLWELIVTVLHGKTNQNNQARRDLCTNQREVRSTPQTIQKRKKISWNDQWFGQRWFYFLKRQFFSSGSFVVWVWRQWSGDQDDHTREEARQWDEFPQPTELFLIGCLIQSNWIPRSKSNKLTPRTNSQTYWPLGKFHTWWMESSCVFV